MPPTVLSILRNQAEVTDLGQDQGISHVLSNFSFSLFLSLSLSFDIFNFLNYLFL